jgi:plastocyanin
MHAMSQPGQLARRALLRRAVGGAGAVLLTTALAQAADATAEVRIDNFAFSPTPLRVKKGVEVRWMNEDDIPHSIVCAALNLRSKPMDTGGGFSYRFERTGTFNYICGLHPHMKGQVVVSA